MKVEFRATRFEKFIEEKRWHYRPISKKIRDRNNQNIKSVKKILKPIKLSLIAPQHIIDIIFNDAGLHSSLFNPCQSSPAPSE